MKFLEVILGFAFLVGLWFCFAHYIRFLSKLTCKRIKKRLESGKISNAKLIRSYNSFKKWKDCKWLAILTFGLLYKEYIKIQNMYFNAYKEEMIKRNLPL
ncbi:hypothetical protein [Gilliamella sp. GillExp13]|uniref:hypothetical protein n=1 Tax=Gilliamella sp. GillExp13 TaxID=3120243 RepID=UPI00080DFFC5|nr:hypothetical protein [Gilliamella apicola]OCG63990.1 hypothetical protein A9G37_07945 [Gilliamella apicola]